MKYLKIEAATKNIQSTEASKVCLDSLIAATQNEIDAVTQLIAEYDAKIEQKLSEISEQEESIDKKYDQMMDRLVFSYEEGTASYLELVLSSDSLFDFLSQVDRVSSMMDFDQTLMKELSDQLKVLQDEKTVLENTRSEQQALEESLDTKKAELEQDKKDADAYIAQLQSAEESYAAQYEKIKAEEAATEKELQKLLAERARNGGGQYWGGEFIWPVPSVYRTISSGYGWRTLWGRSDFHRGIDIPAPYGTNIFASNGGTVVKAEYHYSWGYYVLIDHGGGYSSLYAHNSQLLVSPGDVVQQGDVIAKMGSTGNSTGPHCHLEIWLNGALQNPLGYVRQP